MSGIILTAMIHSAAVAHGLEPKLLLAIAKQESSLRPHVVSSTGDVGLMQISPRTARAFGCDIKRLKEPRVNIDCAAKYLAHLKEKYSAKEPHTWATRYHSRNDVLRFRYKLALSRHMK